MTWRARWRTLAGRKVFCDGNILRHDAAILFRVARHALYAHCINVRTAGLPLATAGSTLHSRVFATCTMRSTPFSAQHHITWRYLVLFKHLARVHKELKGCTSKK